MGNTKIEWTDKTWSPIRARVKRNAHEIAMLHGWRDLADIALKMVGRVGPHCEMCSHGCNHCYSLTNNGRCLPANGTGLPFDKRSRELVDIFVDDKILGQPLHWRAPVKIFVENQSDLFGEWVPFEMVDKVFAVMALSQEHTYQVLTKRANRMLEYATDMSTARCTGRCDALLRFSMPPRPGVYAENFRWPLPNVWLGVSAEDQTRAADRIPSLLRTPAAKRFVSYEPALGPIDISPFIPNPYQRLSGGYRGDRPELMTKLDWLIAGGESGPGARPPQPEWFASVRDQCQVAGVAYFFKQWGAWGPRAVHGEKPLSRTRGAMVRVGKKEAGALLEGREWREFPR